MPAPNPAKAGHDDEAVSAMKTTWNSSTSLRKAEFIFSMLRVGLFYFLPSSLSVSLGLQSNSHFKLTKVLDQPLTYSGAYHLSMNGSNTVIWRGRDGKLFIRSPPQLNQAVKDEIARCFPGSEPGCMLLSMIHDTCADQWKDAFPTILTVCGDADRAAIQNRVSPVDHAIENLPKELMDNYWIDQVIPYKFARYADQYLVMNVEDSSTHEKKKAICFGCGYTYIPFSWTQPSSYLYRLGGLGGRNLRLALSYSYVFTSSTQACKTQHQQVMSTVLPLGLHALLFLHGECVVGDEKAKDVMQRAQLNLSGFHF